MRSSPLGKISREFLADGIRLSWDNPLENRIVDAVILLPFMFFLVFGWAPGLYMFISGVLRYGMLHNPIIYIVWFSLWTGFGLVLIRMVYIAVRGGGPVEVTMHGYNLSYRPRKRMLLQFSPYVFGKWELSNLCIVDMRTFRGLGRAAGEGRVKVLYEEPQDGRKWWLSALSMAGASRRAFMDPDKTTVITFDAGGYRYFLGAGLPMTEKEWLRDLLAEWLEGSGGPDALARRI